MNRGRLTIEELATRVGEELGVSDWMVVDQRRIDGFADATGDRQFIHVDPVAARETPFGGTIAHGFMTLSLVAPFSLEVLPEIVGARMSINYGLNRLRFVSPVRCGARVRGRFKLTALAPQDNNCYLQTLEAVVEIEDSPRPALVAEWLIRVML